MKSTPRFSLAAAGTLLAAVLTSSLAGPPAALRGQVPAAPTPGPVPAAVTSAGEAAPRTAATVTPTTSSGLLPTGKTITTKVRTTVQNVGSLPENLLTTPDRQFVITSDLGFREALWVTRASDGQGVTQVEFPASSPGDQSGSGLTSHNGLYYGLALGADGVLYAAQGANDTILPLRLNLTTGDVTQSVDKTGNPVVIKTKTGDFPAGLALDGRGYLYVTNNDPGTSLAVPQPQAASVVVYDVTGVKGNPANAAQVAEVGRYTFPTAVANPLNFPYATSNFPLAVAVLADGSKAYVASQRDGTVTVFNVADPRQPTPTTTLATGLHPAALLLNQAQNLLVVANAHSDSLSVVDTGRDAVVGTLSLAPAGSANLPGVTPLGMALSADERTLYVACADLNAVAVVDFTDPTAPALRGYLPVGWYPTGVAVSPDGARLLVANAKGVQARYPNPGYLLSSGTSTQYDENLIEGAVTTFALPTTAGELARNTAQVSRNNSTRPTAVSTQLRRLGVASGKIQHVIYIIKENRTYDQVLGDLPRGNGDPSLTLFGRDVTPNLHALAERFVLLDNFYDCSEVSFDGWVWSTQGIANEYIIKNVPYNYSGRGRVYDAEGQNNGYPVGGFPATDADGKALSQLFPGGLPPITDVAGTPNGHIWDAALRGGLTYRNYGFWVSSGVSLPAGGGRSVQIFPDNYPNDAGTQPGGHDLAGRTDVDFRKFDLSYADSDGPADAGAPYSTGAYGKYQAANRFQEFRREFNEMLALDPTGAAVPNFMTVRLMSDHTEGFSPGAPSPRAHVADNDYGIGQLVELISQSAVWEHTALFVIEDDSQDGADHVDCHRSTCYVISPYVKQASVDHTFYNTDSVLHAMENLLGVDPLCQYDRIAVPVAQRAFGRQPRNHAPYQAIVPAASILGEKNPTLAELRAGDPRRRLAEESLKMDFTAADRVPPERLNEIIWKSVRGAHAALPASVHRISVARLHGAEPRADRDGDGDGR